MDNVEAKVKELVTDFKLEEALDVLIAQAQTQTQRKQNALLVLKGKLAMLEEQNLNGMLDPSDLARQRATIAHQILDIADGSSLDYELPETAPTPPPLIQKNINLPASGGASFGKYLLIGGLLLTVVVVGMFISENIGENKSGEAENPAPTQPKQEQAANDTPMKPSGSPVKVLDFPNIKKTFIFLDFRYEFVWADAEMVSDQEIKLKIRSYITCKSNLGICYRAEMRIYADGKPIAPTEQSNTAGWVEHDATITDDLAFVLPADAKEFHIELSRDHSTWKRAFKILTR